MSADNIARRILIECMVHLAQYIHRGDTQEPIQYNTLDYELAIR